jgi:hypothetical protein
VIGLQSPSGSISSQTGDNVTVVSTVMENYELGDVTLHWLIRENGVELWSGTEVVTASAMSGTITLTSQADLTDGGLVDLSRDGLVVFFWYDGSDIAGNGFSGHGSSSGDPFDPVEIVRDVADFGIDRGGTSVSRTSVEEEDVLRIRVSIENRGSLEGMVNVKVLDYVGGLYVGVIDDRDVTVSGLSSEAYDIDWTVNQVGDHTVRVQIVGGEEYDIPQTVRVSSRGAGDDGGGVSGMLLVVLIVVVGAVLGVLFKFGGGTRESAYDEYDPYASYGDGYGAGATGYATGYGGAYGPAARGRGPRGRGPPPRRR